MTPNTVKRNLLVSDFDQTLSHHDSGLILSEMLGIHDFRERAAGLADIHLVQQGAELAYLLLHDPDFRRTRREHLIEVGKRVRPKENLPALTRMLTGIEGCQFDFYVVSAAPQEVIQSALEGVVEPGRIFGTRFRYNPSSGEIESIIRVPAGYGKVVVVDELRDSLSISPDRIIYVGDGSSDVHVMLHLNRLSGLTIAVSENPYITQIAKRTVLGDDAVGVLIPILEEVIGWNSGRIRLFFEAHGFALREWSKTRTDNVVVCPAPAHEASA